MGQFDPVEGRARRDPVVWRTMRWMIALIAFVGALAVLFPMAVEAVRELVRLM